MGLESATFISGLVPSNPVHATDDVSQGDDHLRLLKSVLQGTFPNADKAFYFPDYAGKTANYTILAADMHKLIGADASGGAFTLTLPTLAAGDDGWTVDLQKIDTSANAVTISGTVNGEASPTIRVPYERMRLRWSGGVWFMAASSPRRGLPVRTVTGSVTLGDVDFGSIVLYNGAAPGTITLPAVAGRQGQWVIVKRIHATSDFTLDGNASETIDGATTRASTAQFEAVLIVAGTTEWHVADRFNGTFTNPPTLSGNNTWSGSNTFNGGLTAGSPFTANDQIIHGSQTLTDAANVSWDMGLQPNAVLTATGAVGASRNLSAPSGETANQWGLFRFIQDATGGRALVFNAAYHGPNGGVPDRPEQSGSATTLYLYWVRGTDDVVIVRLWSTGSATVGCLYGWREFELANPFAVSTTYTQAHGLPRVPSAVQGYLECVNAVGANGFALGDRIEFSSLADGTNDNRKPTLAFNATNVIIKFASSTPRLIDSSAAFAGIAITAADWKVGVRVYE